MLPPHYPPERKNSNATTPVSKSDPSAKGQIELEIKNDTNACNIHHSSFSHGCWFTLRQIQGKMGEEKKNEIIKLKMI